MKEKDTKVDIYSCAQTETNTVFYSSHLIRNWPVNLTQLVVVSFCRYGLFFLSKEKNLKSEV